MRGEREGGRGKEGERGRGKIEEREGREGSSTNITGSLEQCRLTSPVLLLGLQTFVQYTV